MKLMISAGIKCQQQSIRLIVLYSRVGAKIPCNLASDSDSISFQTSKFTASSITSFSKLEDSNCILAKALSKVFTPLISSNSMYIIA
jgi:hypothetical protein